MAMILLHYSTLQTQFPTSNVHFLYTIRYQYRQNNTQDRARWQTSGYSEKENGRVALSSSLPRAFSLYCLLLTLPTAYPLQVNGYITICFAVLSAVGREPVWELYVRSLSWGRRTAARVFYAPDCK